MGDNFTLYSPPTLLYIFTTLPTLLYILSATNWWNTSRMFGSRSWVKSSVSRVVLYLSTCNMV